MKRLGVKARRARPGFPDDPLYGIRYLASGLERFGDDFGDSRDQLIIAAEREAFEPTSLGKEPLGRAVGDLAVREDVQNAFRG